MCVCVCRGGCIVCGVLGEGVCSKTMKIIIIAKWPYQISLKLTWEHKQPLLVSIVGSMFMFLSLDALLSIQPLGLD